MASIRLLKKDINRLTFDLLTECYALKHYNNTFEDDQFDSVIKKLVYLRNDLILRTNHPELNADTDSIKEHYRNIQMDLVNLYGVVENIKNNEM